MQIHGFLRHEASRTVGLVSMLAACGGQTLATGGVSDGSGGFSGGSGGTLITVGGRVGDGGRDGDAGVTAVGGASGSAPSGNGGTPASGGVAGAGGFSGERGDAAAGRGGSADSGGIFGTGGAFDGGRADGSDGSIAPPDPCSFTFDATTVVYGGRFAPKNVGAIWIQDDTGLFVKTLRTWGGARLNLVVQWNSVSAGNRVDAITSATRSNEGPVSGDWNCTDSSRRPVPEGAYWACVEDEEDIVVLPGSGTPHYTCLPFLFPAGPSSGTWPDQPPFVSMSWSFR